MSLRCLIVDDEPIARQIVEKYAAYLPELQVIASCGDALQAKQILAKQTVDILFLDINMPVLDGLAFVKTLQHQPQIIFTTAYKEYALDAFDLRACDYLLKPFSLERFIQAVDKAKEVIVRQTQAVAGHASVGSPAAIHVKSEGKIFQINCNELLFAEAQGNNVKVVTATGTIVTTMTFSAFEDQLPGGDFIRVHRSFIVNKNRIRVIEGNRILIQQHEIPIGANYRELFLKSMRLK